MSYTILKSDGTLLTTIADGTADNTTGLTLPGPNYVGYGLNLDENLVKLLENFAANTAPAGNNLEGQLWFNKSSQTLNVFTNQGYLPVSGITLSTSQPLTANAGNIWFDTATNQLYLYDGNNFNLIGPNYTKNQGVSGAIPVTVNDASTSGLTHNILQLQFGGTVLAIFSSDTEFLPSPPIAGFPRIYPGLTINNSYFPGSNQFYTNANAAAYIPTDPTILDIESNINLLSGNLSSFSTYANASVQQANIDLTNYINSEITIVNNLIDSSVANLNATANAIVANTQIYVDNLTANLNAVYNNLLANISTIDSGLAGVTVAWTANAANQQVEINSLISGAYTNSNVASYLPAYNGPIAASVVTATTLPYNTSNTALATTAFVQSVLPRGMIVMWGGTIVNIPVGWQLCDGSNGTPDLRNQFIMGAGSAYNPGQTGGSGSASFSIGTSNLPAHSHSFSGTGTASGTTATSFANLYDPTHVHTVNQRAGAVTDNGTSGGGGALQGNGPLASYGVTLNPASTGISDTGHTHSFSASVTVSGTTGTTGSGTPISVATVPPFYALAYIQKMY